MSVEEQWCKYAKVYDPIKIGSIDGTDVEPHDRAIERAIYSTYVPNRHVKGKPQFRLVRDVVTGMPKGYAFIEYEEEAAAEEAYRLANKMVLDGNTIFVDFECERLLKGWKPRRLGGGFGGKKESGQLRFGGRDRPFRKPIALELKEEELRRRRDAERARIREEYERKRRERGKPRSPSPKSRSRSPRSPHRR
nr:unnamed protein product [Callosobruchus analis]